MERRRCRIRRGRKGRIPLLLERGGEEREMKVRGNYTATLSKFLVIYDP
jgi:hypothetical protein